MFRFILYRASNFAIYIFCLDVDGAFLYKLFSRLPDYDPTSIRVLVNGLRETVRLSSKIRPQRHHPGESQVLQGCDARNCVTLCQRPVLATLNSVKTGRNCTRKSNYSLLYQRTSEFPHHRPRGGEPVHLEGSCLSSAWRRLGGCGRALQLVRRRLRLRPLVCQ